MDTKRTNGEIWLHGVEVMTLAVFTLYLIYLYSIFYWTYGRIVLISGIVYLIYLAIKLIIMRRRMKIEYVKSLRDIDEIVKK